MTNSCKKPYRTQFEAERALTALRKKPSRARKETGSYLCPKCGHWHLTSKSASQVAPWRKGRNN